MNRTHAGIVLIGVGTPLIVVSILSGGMSPGFELEIPMVLLRVGVMFVLLGIITFSLRSISVKTALIASIVTLALVFVAGMAVMYYDFTSTTPTGESPLTVTMLVANQAGITIALSPIPAGYVAGVLERQGQLSAAYRILIGTTVAAWIISSLLMLARGPVSMLTVGFVMMMVIAAMGIALFPRYLLREATNPQPR